MIDAAPSDGLVRCAWAQGSPEYLHYHDREWGRPEGDDQRLFEQLSLEGFQAGLSWRTILSKRAAFRKAFAQFDCEKVARFGERDIERLLQDAGIVRHRAKIEAVINNARHVIDTQHREGSLAALLWRFEPQRAKKPRAAAAALSTCPESDALSKELKKRGWKFVGSTTVYAFMQSVGMVNDHVARCHAHAQCEALRQAFRRP
jgi:DNA-3-methyladenine glycosylase I